MAVGLIMQFSGVDAAKYNAILSRHAHEEDMLRREHLERVAAITGGGE